MQLGFYWNGYAVFCKGLRLANSFLIVFGKDVPVSNYNYHNVYLTDRYFETAWVIFSIVSATLV